MKQKPKELVKDEVFGDNSTSNGMKMEYKKLGITTKPKELDWEKEFDKNFRYENWNGEQKLKRKIIRKGVETYISATAKQVKQFIQSLLTQQRTELLEEIEKEVIGKNVEISRIDWKEDMGEYKEAQNDLRDEQRQKLTQLRQSQNDLLVKKDKN